MILTANIENLSGDTAVVTFSGPLTLGTSLKIVDSQVQKAIESGITRMVFDLSSVDFIDSAGLGMMVCTYGAINQKQGRLRLCGVSQRVETLLKMTHTNSFLPVDSRRDDSLAAMN